MAQIGIPGSRLSNPEPAPEDTTWLLTAPGYRIGAHPTEGAIVEVLEYHPGYLALSRADLERLLAALPN